MRSTFQRTDLISYQIFHKYLGRVMTCLESMNSAGNLTFRKLYRKRLLWALRALNKPTTSHGEDEAHAAGSSRNIKLAADVSLALTANGAAWSHALINRISREKKNRPALRKILGPIKLQAIIAERARFQSRLLLHSKLRQAHMQQHKKSHGFRGRQTLALYRFFCSSRIEPAISSDGRLVKRRTRQLQRLVPGGMSMDTSCLLRETADYITSLTTQVEVLQSLVNSANNNQHAISNNFVHDYARE